MPGQTRSDTGLSRLDMSGRNPTPGGPRTDMGLDRIGDVLIWARTVSLKCFYAAAAAAAKQ